MSSETTITEGEQALTFSICTLVTNFYEYLHMWQSFESKGFIKKNTEFLYVDNTKTNIHDGYSSIRYFLLHAKGEYLVICHQDVELIEDSYQELLSCLQELEKHDPSWAIAGNAGSNKVGKRAIRITDPNLPNISIGDFPEKVQTLDENFLVIKRSSCLSTSSDLHGFHFYGLDLCLQARLRGYSSYVIDFHLLHKSAGREAHSENFRKCLFNIEKKYAKFLPAAFIQQTTCDLVFIGWIQCFSFLRKLAVQVLERINHNNLVRIQEKK